ncbi:ATP-binding protein [Macromonas nakdongensis]|uniref:ATP-binding protein n=1 Tax=Macromonas nakdongensis TaxID=1843082 RepID=UPI000C3467A0|nr:ATP-binding protein [Macromonas nakdongensis]
MKHTALHTPGAPRLLWRHLWVRTLLALLAIWFTLAGVAYYTGVHEAEEITDGQLVSTAELLLRQSTADTPADHPPEAAPRHALATGYSPELRVVAWAHGHTVWDTHGMAAQLPDTLVNGHQTLTLPAGDGHRRWRVFVADADGVGGHRVAVLIDTRRHGALGRDIAEHIVRPALVLLPLVALLLAWTIRRGLRPLNELSQAIGALDVDAGQTLPPEQPFRELSTTVQAINGLVERLQTQWRRERRFTSDVAHELRTPLAALVWQARLARADGEATVRDQALQQVEHDALRAGRILTQLLDLARAQGPDAAPDQVVDLCELARQVVTDHVPQAHERRHDLSLDAPDTPVWVAGRSAMLALALRNLVDNALRHTPPDTRVEVVVQPAADGSVTLAVRDDGASRRPDAHPPRPGMGIGLTLVQRIADAHGIPLRQDAGPPPFATRYALVWPATATPPPEGVR